MNNGNHSTTTSRRVLKARTEKGQEEAPGAGGTVDESDTGRKGSSASDESRKEKSQIDLFGFDVVCSQPRR